MTQQDPELQKRELFWQRKLLAFLHDPPSKPFNIAEHEKVRDSLVRNAGFAPAEVPRFFDKICDHTAAAADRIVFPRPAALKADWNKTLAFKHPLGGGELQLKSSITPTEAEALVASQQPHNFDWSKVSPDADKQSWARFFVHWRLWPQKTAEQDPRALYLPADTRIPDHTIWTHCSIVSALHACVKIEEGKQTAEFKPAFLLVQIGPVQEFIAQARSTRDLWSGSYLLSWLIAHGIKAVTDRIGPDCVIFPSLRGQPLFDFLHKESLYDELDMWGELGHAEEHVLTPNLPNRFLAVVPARSAQDLAMAAEKAIHGCLAEQMGALIGAKELAEAVEKAMAEELKNIGDACVEWFKTKGMEMDESTRKRWDQQLGQFLSITWQIWPWESDVQKAIKDSGNDSLQLAYKAAVHGIPKADLDPRNYRHRSWQEGEVWKSEVSDNPPVIDNPGFAWAAHYVQVDRMLAARRNTRDFEAWATDDANRDGAVKDMLSGKEEVIGSEEWQKNLANISGKFFKGGERLGALNLIKRVWHEAYLKNVRHLQVYRAVRFESLPEIAAGCPDPLPDAPKYVAIIALDADSMGEWVSGAKAPKWKTQLAAEAEAYFRERGGLLAQLLDTRRHVSPSYHLQLSEALANFALYLAGPIVECFDGQLIYAGGDDVLAMLPAANALSCARALRMAFRGDPQLHTVFEGAMDIGDQKGFVGLSCDVEKLKRLRRFIPIGYPLLMPGMETDISAGIAIGHMHSPLQNLVEAAREVEKRAKKDENQGGYGKSAFVVSLFKRSGETLQWGAKWDNAAIELAEKLAELSAGDKPSLSAKFPYALARLLRPYALGEDFRIIEQNGFNPFEIFPAEFRHCVQQQGKGDLSSLTNLAKKYLDDCKGRRLDDFLGPFLTTAFINREGGE